MVHIRRGDVEPCDVYTKDRYLTNHYYIELIRKYSLSLPTTTTTTRVIIHSQNRSFEQWTDFDVLSLSNNNITNHDNENTTTTGEPQSQPSPKQTVVVEWKLDAPLRDFWYDVLVRADVFIMSKSALSQAAAILMDFPSYSKKVVCTPYVYCHSLWITVSKHHRRKEQVRLHTMIADKCSGNATFDARTLSQQEIHERMGEEDPSSVSTTLSCRTNPTRPYCEKIKKLRQKVRIKRLPTPPPPNGES